MTKALHNRLRAIAHLLILQSLLPLSLTYIFVQWLRTFAAGASGDGGDSEEASQPSVATSNSMPDEDSATAEETESEDDSSKGQESDDDGIRPASDKRGEETVYSIVLTGGKMSKTLHLVRCLRSYADANSNIRLKIVVLESQRFRYNATRFSRCVDHFVTITSPRDGKEAYMNDIYLACKEFQATHFLPVAAPVEAVYDALLKPRLERDLGVTVLHMNYQLCCTLDDKHRFGSFLRHTLRVGSLRTVQVKNNEEVGQWNDLFKKEREAGKLPRSMVLKNLQYDPIHRLDLFQLPAKDDDLHQYLQKIEQDGSPITKDKPWQLQEFLAGGVEYAAMIVVRNNHLVTMTCCRSSASQLNYVHVEVPAVRLWVDSFMESLQKQHDEDPENPLFQLTGQLCFDFMVVKEPDGGEKAYPIECNPRVHTQSTIYTANDTRALLGAMLLSDDAEDCYMPGATSCLAERGQEMMDMLNRDYGLKSKKPETYWFYNELFKAFNNGILLRYEGCDSNTTVEHTSCHEMNLMSYFLLALYLPSFVFAAIVAVLVWIAIMPAINVTAPTLKANWTTWRSVLCRFWRFVVERLHDTARNREADMWDKDPLPFLFKNHVQVPVRLLATIRTGVEWKKVDFAIGKVVEVGGD